MLRDLIVIDEEKCDGCGLCITACHEGALQIINGKAVLINDLLCDGLGACIGDCPLGAIKITNKDAEPYDEVKVMQHLSPKGKDVVYAHLKHLKDHKEDKWLDEGIAWLNANTSSLPFDLIEVLVKLSVEENLSGIKSDCSLGTCSGEEHKSFDLADNESVQNINNIKVPSALNHWPVQMHLINPQSSVFFGADLLLSADCVAHAIGDFHNSFLKAKKLAIFCPKLDSNTESYIEKLKMMIDVAKINTITVMMMEVPCCHSMLKMVQIAQQESNRKLPVKVMIVSIEGKILKDEWLS